MSVTLEQVRAHLDPEEPKYRAAASALGPDALPILEQLVRGGDAMLASKAAYLASLIDAPGAADVLEAAARNPDPVVRVAAAAGVRNRPDSAASSVFVDLLSDRDPGVRTTALESVPEDAGDAVRQAVVSMVRGEAEPAMRECSRRALDRLNRGARQRSEGPSPSAGFTTPGGEGAGGGSADDALRTDARSDREGQGMGGGSLDAERALAGDESSGAGMGGGDLGGGDLRGGRSAPDDEGPIGGGWLGDR